MLGPGQAVIDIVLRAAAPITAEPSDRGARNSPEVGPPLLGDAPGSAVQFLGGLGNIPAAPATGLWLCAQGALPGAARATQATNAATPTRTTEEDQSPMRSPERRDAPGIERPIVAAEAPRV